MSEEEKEHRKNVPRRILAICCGIGLGLLAGLGGFALEVVATSLALLCLFYLIFKFMRDRRQPEAYRIVEHDFWRLLFAFVIVRVLTV